MKERERTVHAATELKAAASVFDRPTGAQRQRAPKQVGRRAQLTIPEPVWDRAEALAGLMGTTPNDVLALFAAKGMVLADRQLETARIAAERIAAFRSSSAGAPDAEMPPLDELDEAAKLLRRELDAPEE